MPTPFVLLFYRNPKPQPGMSHVGLGNNCVFVSKVLKTLGITAIPLGVTSPADVIAALAAYPQATHGVVEAIWMTPAQMGQIAAARHGMEWTCRNHSNIAFLQVEPQAIANFRGYAETQDGTANFVISANNDRFCQFWTEAYSVKCLYLPNLYPDDVVPTPKVTRGAVKDVLRISSYGANRILKNHTTSAAAALMIARRLGRDLEFHINTNREPGGKEVVRAIQAMMANVPHAVLVEDDWTTWSAFRHLAASMDLGLCPTFTETFCLTAADHVAAGVPVVGTDAIEWLPPRAWASMDDAQDVCEVGINLLLNSTAAATQASALAAYMVMAKQRWVQWLGA